MRKEELVFDTLQEDLKELEWKIEDLENQLVQYRDLVDRRPVFVVGYKYDDKLIVERKYVGIFSTENLAYEFIKNCTLKTPTNERKFKVKSSLGGFDVAYVEHFYVPDDIPLNPTIE